MRLWRYRRRLLPLIACILWFTTHDAAGLIPPSASAGVNGSQLLVSCSVSLVGQPGGSTGPNTTAAAGPPTAFGIACWSEAEDGGSLNSSVDVRLGAELYTWLNSSKTGGGGGGGGGGAAAQLSGVRVSQREPVANTSDGGGTPDWGLTIVGISRLRLVNSVLSDLPLSPAGPLLEVLGCKELSLQNVALSRLTGQAPGAFGAVRAAGSLRRAAVQGLRCHDVWGASGWACLLLSADGTGGSSEGGNTADTAGTSDLDVSITDSAFSGSTVVGPAEAFGAACSMPSSVGGQMNLGFGAVLVQPGGRSLRTALHDTILRGNAGGCGGALALAGPLGQVLLDLDASAAEGNNATWGGALAVLPSSAAAAAAAAAVRISLANGSSLSTNTAEAGGGAVFVSGTETSLSLSGGSSMSLNRAISGSGGALLLMGGSLSGLDLTDSALDGNAAPLGFGGALAVALSLVDARLHNSSLSHNTALGGGALLVGGAVHNLTVTGGSTVANNTAVLSGSGDPNAGNGGLAYAVGSISSVTISASFVFGNRASRNGGGLLTWGNLTDVVITQASRVFDNQALGSTLTTLPDGRIIDGQGGFAAAYARVSGLTISDGSHVFANAAGFAGAVVFCDASMAGVRITTHSQVYNNSATISGVLAVSGDLEDLRISNGSRVYNNTATSSGGFMLVDGNLGVLLIDGAAVYHNSAAQDSGGFAFVTGNVNSVRILGGSELVATKGAVFSTDTSFEGIYFSGGTEVHDNRASSGGGVVYADEDASLLVIEGGCQVWDNAADGAGGVAAAGSSMALVTISNSSVYQNTAASGGVFFTPGPLRGLAITAGSKVHDNAATSDDRLSGGGVAIAGITLVGNRAGASGGAIAAASVGGSSVEACNVSANSAGLNGGGLYLEGLSGRLEVSWSTFEGNAAAVGRGGSLYVSAQQARTQSAAGLSIGDTLFRSGTAGFEGGAVVVNVSSGDCAAVHATGPACPHVTLRNTSFVNCSALSGDGGGLAATLSGRSLALTACRFEGCSAELGRGGGAFVESSTGPTVVSDTDFASNHASTASGGGGGGLAWTAAGVTAAGVGQLAAPGLDVSGCLFSNNSVGSGSQSAAGQSAGSGGGLLAVGVTSITAGLSASVAVSLSRFEGNSAPSGAGASVNGIRAATVLNCSFDSNQATSTGGGLLLQGVQQAWLEHLGFISNAAAVGGGLGVSTDASQEQNSTARRLLSSASEESSTVIVLADFLFANNTALKVRGPASPTLLYAGYGGGIFLSLSVAAALISGSFRGNSASEFGPGVATLQDMGTCSRDDQQANTTSAALPSVTDWQGPYASTAAALTNAAARGCWGLAVYDVDPISAASAGNSSNGGAGNSPRNSFLWVRDPSASAISAGCSQQAAFAISTADTAAAVLVVQASGPQMMSSSPLARLSNAVQQCAGTSPSGQPSLSGFVSLPPTGMRLWLDNATAFESGQTLRRVPGVATSLRVELVNALGQRVTDHGLASASLAFGLGSFGTFQTEPTGPAPLFLGLAWWESLVLKGWPGTGYRLNASVTTSGGTSLEVAPLSLDVELLPCPLGSSVEQGPASRPDLTSCQPCRALQFSLWVDPRNSSANAVESYSNDTLASISSEAVCQPCPANAHCPGGGALAPRPGYWHSAANSTAIHRCFSDAACTPPSPPVAANATAMATDVSTALVACQQAWYASQPPGARVLAAFNASSPDSTCLLWDSGPGYAAATPYTELECAPGYHGRLCATCDPGSFLSPSFECNPCPSPGATVVLGVVAILATMALIIFTAWTTFNNDYMRDETEISASDKLALLITHMQYLIIITRLNLGWPDVINKLTSALSSLTGVTAFAFSPACIAKLESDGQARALYSWGLLCPICATALAMALWSLRYAFFNQSLLRRGGQSKMATKHRRQWSYNAVVRARQLAPDDDTELDAAEYGEPGDADDGATRLGQPQPSLLVPAPSLLAHRPKAAAAPPLPFVVNQRSTTTAGLAPLAPHEERNKSSPSRLPDPFSQQLGPITERSPSSTQEYDDPSAASPLTLPSLRPTDNTRLSPSEPAVVLPDSRLLTAHSPQLPVARSRASRTSTSTVNRRSSRMQSLTSLTSRLSVLSSGLQTLQTGAKTITQVRPSAAIVHLDQGISLPRQLRVVLLVATSILYPALAQVSLSTFACRKLDTGEGPYPETQLATWGYGYWLSDMNQECYQGPHFSFYLPLGVVCVIVFCAVPPLAIFWLLWRKQAVLEEPKTRAMYGFLYHRYRPECFFFDSVKQVQVLMLVVVDVFANAIYEYQQALLLLCVLLCIGVLNMSCRALRAKLLVLLEYLSLMVLALSITLGLFFVGGGAGSEMGLDSQTAEDAVAIAILIVNASLLAAFGLLIAWPGIARLQRRAAAAAVRRAEKVRQAQEAQFDPVQASSQLGQERDTPDSLPQQPGVPQRLSALGAAATPGGRESPKTPTQAVASGAVAGHTEGGIVKRTGGASSSGAAETAVDPESHVAISMATVDGSGKGI
ncbi:hypothetical protein HYH03_014352 [Edaphochlamys debaryana]|uniref:Uncharacterized protein n=1 Tax=Edaphochlamys debaryana TaxID=47281 RepID=A0A835XWA7_9CHLO|nr:hypothetical protein HYH03_014352 [Edaphochlamys debaryana]|eukprot:KAG2486979.1 hypothetical protein HYH03_014352 [Edaphochlamys debaryana]